MVQGTFKCYGCDLGYNDLDKYREHFAEVVHNHKGVAPCNLCGISTEYDFTGKKAVGQFPALCKACRKKTLEEDELD